MRGKKMRLGQKERDREKEREKIIYKGAVYKEKHIIQRSAPSLRATRAETRLTVYRAHRRYALLIRG